MLSSNCIDHDQQNNSPLIISVPSDCQSNCTLGFGTSFNQAVVRMEIIAVSDSAAFRMLRRLPPTPVYSSILPNTFNKRNSLTLSTRLPRSNHLHLRAANRTLPLHASSHCRHVLRDQQYRRRLQVSAQRRPSHGSIVGRFACDQGGMDNICHRTKHAQRDTANETASPSPQSRLHNAIYASPLQIRWQTYRAKVYAPNGHRPRSLYRIRPYDSGGADTDV